MKFLRFNFYVLLAGLCVLTSCEVTHDVWLNDMQGSLDYNVPSLVGKNQEVVFSASGITTPSQGISYEWQAEGFNPSSGTGQSFTTTTPGDAGDFPVTVTVKSTGYYDQRAQKTIAVQDCLPLPGVLDFTASPTPARKNFPVTFSANGIGSSVAEVTYTWDAPGFASTSATGSTFSTGCLEAGKWPVTVIASADNYCDIKVSKEVEVIDCIPLPGSLNFTVSPTPAVKGLPVKFTANGISSSVTGVSYTWDAPGFAPETQTGSTFEPNCPLDPRFYPVTLTASADNYCDTSITKEIEVIGGMIMTGSTLTMSANASEIYAGNPVSFTAKFLAGTGAPANVSYKWICDLCTPPSGTGEQYTPKAPSAAFSVKLIAEPPQGSGYNSMDTTYNFIPKNCQSMLNTGTTLELSIPNETQLITGSSVKFRANNVNSTVTGVSYTWNVEGFQITSQSGNELTVTCPDPGKYNVSVKANATNYCDENTPAQLVTVIKGIDMGDASALTVNIPTGPIYLGASIPMSATFTPSVSPSPVLTYKWECVDCEAPKTYEGPTYNPVSLSAGSHNVTVTVSAPNHTPVEKTVTFTSVCKSMDITGEGFSVTSAKVSKGTDITFTANTSDAIAGSSYTWNFDSQFTIKAGDIHSSTVTVTAPASITDELLLPVTLKMEAPTYCAHTFTKNITIVDCYEILPKPNIDPLHTQLNSYGTYTFNTSPDLLSLPNVNFKWSITPDGFTYTPTSGPTATEFKVIAPSYTPANQQYILVLEVSATNYCTSKTTQSFTIQPFNGPLTGTIEITKALNTPQRQYPSIWLAQGRQDTLHALYFRGDGEDENVNVNFEWFLHDGSGGNTVPFPDIIESLTPDNASIVINPGTIRNNHRLMVKVKDKRGGFASTQQLFAYDVQKCDFPATAAGLFIDINYQCNTRTTGDRNWQAYTKDDDGNIYPIVKVGAQWWHASNYRRKVDPNNEYYNDTYGVYYKQNTAVMSSIDGSFCPKGWRVPSQAHWDVNVSSGYDLRTTTSGGSQTPGNIKWQSGNGTDKYGFSAIPAGYYNPSNSSINNISSAAYFLASDANIITEFSDGSQTLTHPLNHGNPLSYYYTIRCILDTGISYP